MAFFHAVGKKAAFRQFRNIIERDFEIESEPIRSIYELLAHINFEINCSSKFILVTVSFVARLTEEGMKLSVETAVPC